MKNNSIIKSSTFRLQQKRMTELTAKAPFDASSGIPAVNVYHSKSIEVILRIPKFKG